MVSAEEVWALVRVAALEQVGVLFLTAVLTGLRRGGLLGLRWRDVDLAGSTMAVSFDSAASEKRIATAIWLRRVLLPGCKPGSEVGRKLVAGR